jgi:hypothetical protein
MLAALDVSSVPVLVSTNAKLREDIPTPFQFNHAVLAIDVDDLGDRLRESRAVTGDWLLFDPTDPHTELGELPPHLADTQVLLVAPDGDLLATSRGDPWAHRRQIQESLRVDAAGVFRGEIRVTDFGTRASLSSQLIRDEGETGIRAHLMSLLGPQHRIIGVAAHEGRSRETGEHGVQFVARVEGRLTRLAGGGFLLDPSTTRLPEIPKPSDPDRKTGIYLGPPSTLIVKTSWSLPHGLRAREARVSESFGCEGTSMLYRVLAREDDVETRWEFTREGRTVGPERAEEVCRFAEDLGAIGQLVVVLEGRT